MMILMVSCDNFFHEEEDDYIVINNRIKAINLLNGMYSNLVKVYDGYYFRALGRGDDINMYTRQNFYGTDFNGIPIKCIFGSDQNPIPPMDNINLHYYRVIISVNSLLPQLSEENEPDLMGEVYFLRAYAYFTLHGFLVTLLLSQILM